MTRHVTSYGMGADGTAMLLRWHLEPTTRPCDLTDMTIVTSMTGDEFAVTGALVGEHILPVLRRHGIRYVQVARSGASQRDGVAVLSDTREPRTVHLPGRYALSQELLAAGTVPQVGGARLCSLKSKGWPIDWWLRGDLGGEDYRHYMGYEVDEAGRVRRDNRQLGGKTGAARSGVYPLIEWGWDRAACEKYIYEATGVRWPKSHCSYCPFSLCSADGRARLLAAYQSEPAAGARALLIEHVAVTFNPRQTLAPQVRLLGLLASSGRHGEALALYDAELSRLPWRVFEVRRAVRLRSDGKTQAVRSVRTLGQVPRDGAPAALTAAAAAYGVRVDTDDGVPRGWVRRRGLLLPAAEHLLAACPVTPDGPFDKDGPGFAAAWEEAAAAGDGTLPLAWAEIRPGAGWSG